MVYLLEFRCKDSREFPDNHQKKFTTCSQNRKCEHVVNCWRLGGVSMIMVCGVNLMEICELLAAWGRFYGLEVLDEVVEVFGITPFSCQFGVKPFSQHGD